MKAQRVALGLLEEAEAPMFAPQIPTRAEEPSGAAEDPPGGTPSQHENGNTGEREQGEGEGSADNDILDDLDLVVKAGNVSEDELDDPSPSPSPAPPATTLAAASAGLNEETEPGEPAELPRIEFTQPTPPSVTATGCRSLAVEWDAVKEIHPAGPEDDRPRPEVYFRLEMQLVESHPKKNLELTQQLLEDKWETVTTGKLTSHEVIGLKPGLNYAFRVACHLVSTSGSPAVEDPKPSNAAVFHTTPAPPSAPTPVILTSKERKALKFKWPVPEETGGFHDLTYVLELYPPPHSADMLEQYSETFVSVYNGPETSFKVTKLQPGVQYYVRAMMRRRGRDVTRLDDLLKAQNDLGSSPYSAVGEFKTAATVPAQPDPPVCYAVMPSSVYLHWGPPQCNGSPITRFQVQMAHTEEPESWNLVFTGLDNKCEIHNLQPGQRYFFRMSCENDIGRSPVSGPMEVITAAAAPCPPGSAGISNIQLTSADILWHPPAWEGGAPVVHYEVQLYPKSPAALVGGLTQTWVPVFQDNDTKCSVFGLRGGCTYGIRVRCFNQVGVSDFSSVSEFTTAPDLPEPPLPPAIVRAGSGTLDIAWGAPLFDGGDPITAYQLELCSADGGDWALAYSGSTPGCHLSGLVPGTAYSLRVSCANHQGSSALSDVVTGATMPAPPSPPQPLSVVTVTSTAICLAWAPAAANGAPVTSYILEEVRVGDKQEVQFIQLYQGPHMVFESKGLQPYTEYGFRVRAANSAGAGEWGTVAICRTSPAAPGKPENIEVNPTGPEELQVQWAPPFECFGEPVTAYLVELAVASKSKKAASWVHIYTGVEQWCLADKLDAGREYVVRIRATNKVGAGTFSVPVSCRTSSSAPDPPGPLTFSQRASRSVKVRWGAPEEDHGCAVSIYSLEVAELPADTEVPSTAQASWPLSPDTSKAVKWREAYSGPSNTAKVSGLEAGRVYAFRAYAHNAVGPSPPGPVQCMVTSLAPPLQMGVPGASVGLDESSGLPKAHLAQVEVTWQAPPRAEACALPSGFEVEVAEVKGDQAVSTSGADKPFRSLVTASKDATSCMVAGLLGERTYSVRIRAVGEAGAGHGAWSETSSCKTPAFEAPVSSTCSEPQEESSAVVTAAGRKGSGKKVKQRKGKDHAMAEAVKSTAAKRPPKRERFFSKKSINRFMALAIAVALTAFVVFLGILTYKTEWGPSPEALQRHYIEREIAAARQQQMRDSMAASQQQEWINSLPTEHREKLEQLQVLWMEAQGYVEAGMEVPTALVDRLDALDIPPELMELIDPEVAAQMESYGGYYQDYPGDDIMDEAEAYGDKQYDDYVYADGDD